ncbi:hypothetical protein SteCoe_18971 [Stentor coeruleus]|uniref:RAP domain-containing protein n=1 Tax=Stentor coeruleus TaxID=5963 RepID=A0A1R2BVC4_9CILI|nr:hypothetical protein SteCoe_18971 [Stentor coeruleus]
MFFRSKKLFSPEWMKFFTEKRTIKINHARAIKEFNDFSKLVQGLQDSAANNYQDLTDNELLRIASITRAITRTLKFKSKEEAFFKQFIEYVLFKVQIEKNINWTPQAIANYLTFRYNFSGVPSMFNDTVTEELFEKGIQMIEEFDIFNISKATYISYVLCPKYFQVYKTRFLELFSKSSFEHFEMYSIAWIVKALLYNQDFNQISQETLPPNFSELKDVIIKKIKKINFYDWNVSNIALIFNFLKGPARMEIYNTVCEIITDGIENNPSVLESSDNILPFVHLTNIIGYIDPTPETKELTIKLANRLFMQYFIKSNKKFIHSSTYSMKKSFIRGFISALEHNKILNVVYLDLCVTTLGHVLGTTHAKLFRDHLMPNLTLLASLNYTWRFTSNYAVTEEVKSTWQNIITTTENYTTLTENYINLEDEMEIDFFQTNNSIININYLWALCCMDIYQHLSIQTLLNTKNIDPTVKFQPNIYKKLYQVYLWLKHEYSGEIYFNYELLEKIEIFKENYDKTYKHTSESDLHGLVKKSLQQSGVEFDEHVSDFPFVFDFVKKGEKKALVFERDEYYLTGCYEPVLTGDQKVIEKQYKYLGWEVKKIGLKDLLDENTPLFGN